MRSYAVFAEISYNYRMIYIGVVGQIASGKGVLVDSLEKKGFVSFSLSSILHDELKRQGVKKYTRKTLQDLGDQLRRKYGQDILAKKAITKIKNLKLKNKNYVIEGIRNTGEVEYLKKIPNFFLIGVKAKRKLRFQRLLQRSKPWDPKTNEQFMVVDRRDFGIGQDENGQQVKRCLRYCDYVLTNNKDVADFRRKVEKLVESLLKLSVS